MAKAKKKAAPRKKPAAGTTKRSPAKAAKPVSDTADEPVPPVDADAPKKAPAKRRAAPKKGGEQ